MLGLLLEMLLFLCVFILFPVNAWRRYQTSETTSGKSHWYVYFTLILTVTIGMEWWSRNSCPSDTVKKNDFRLF